MVSFKNVTRVSRPNTPTNGVISDAAKATTMDHAGADCEDSEDNCENRGESMGVWAMVKNEHG